MLTYDESTKPDSQKKYANIDNSAISNGGKLPLSPGQLKNGSHVFIANAGAEACKRRCVF
jgi:hypothetical protein